MVQPGYTESWPIFCPGLQTSRDELSNVLLNFSLKIYETLKTCLNFVYSLADLKYIELIAVQVAYSERINTSLET